VGRGYTNNPGLVGEDAFGLAVRECTGFRQKAPRTHRLDSGHNKRARLRADVSVTVRRDVLARHHARRNPYACSKRGLKPLRSTRWMRTRGVDQKSANLDQLALSGSKDFRTLRQKCVNLAHRTSPEIVDFKPLEQKSVNLTHRTFPEAIDFNTLGDRSCFRLNGFRFR